MSDMLKILYVLNMRQKGPLLIKSHLSHTGVDKVIVETLLSNYTEKQWIDSAVSALQKKYNGNIYC